MISAILFDFGGTLDSDGQHWLDRFYTIYADIGLPEIPKSKIKAAFYWAEEQAERDPGMRSASLREMMDRHVHWQFKKLGLESPTLEAKAAAAFSKPADRILRRNRHILEKLSQKGLKLGIISNFYGNIEALCQEFGMKPYLNVILDSTVVGMKKPDAKLFGLALEQLKLAPEQVAFVGDSFERDIIPAKSIGMQTFWIIGGDRDLVPPNPAKVDRVIKSLEDLLHETWLRKKGTS
jgi:putative hydrolase of the HAD superfamily